MLTIFIGGNHEASNYLQELPYGGWVAPNIYYLGYAGVVRVNGLRIAGLSGIYKGNDYLKGRFEFSPYTESTKRSVYHVRQFEVFRLKQLSGKIDIFISHDWPKGIYNHGDKDQLARFKPFLREEMDRDQLGSRPNEDLLNMLQPSYWFAAHLHCKFVAVVQHNDPPRRQATSEKVDDSCDTTEVFPEKDRVTKFLALDKCLPKRRFLQILNIESENHTDDEGHLKFEYDLEWLTILYLTNQLMSVKETYYYLPNEKSANGERYNYTPTLEEMEMVRQKFENDLKIPENFCRTVEVYDPATHVKGQHYKQPKSQINPQSLSFCDTLGVDDPLSLAMLIGGHELSHSSTLDNTEDSALNDSLLDDQLNNTSSNSLGILQSLSPLKRSSCGLVLPEPTANITGRNANDQELQLDFDEKVTSPLKRNHNQESQLEDDQEEQKETTNNIETIFVDVKSLQETIKDSNDVDNLNPTKGTSSSKPPIKKFKRRNQDIYQDKEEDIEKDSL